MDEDASKSKVNDEELDKMIANIQGPSVTPPASNSTVSTPPSDGSTASQSPVIPPTDPPTTPTVEPTVTPPPAPITPIAASPELANIKQNALAELRPLVDRLTLPPEEKFRTLLLIIRSTDDVSLLPVAYEAARAIPGENQRAQALLDVIKEVDFFGQQAK